MTIFEIYIIWAIAFGIMFHIRYVHESLVLLNTLVDDFVIGHPIKSFHPIVYSITYLIGSTVFMPMFIPTVLVHKRYDVVKELTKQILDRYYEVEK